VVTSHGVAHVWRPKGYDVLSAATVVYVHGYWVNADQAWNDHHLEDQFRASGRNALFVVPEAPLSDDEPVAWSNLAALLREVRHLAKLRMPDGPIVAMAHSGGFRTVLTWLSERRLTEVILLDGLYNNEKEFTAWLRGDERGLHRLVLVGAETADHCEDFIKGFKFPARLSAIPDDVASFTRAEKNAQLFFIKSQYDHMGLVTSGKVLPLMLKLAPIRHLAS
jgi:hypothetical protein